MLAQVERELQVPSCAQRLIWGSRGSSSTPQEILSYTTLGSLGVGDGEDLLVVRAWPADPAELVCKMQSIAECRKQHTTSCAEVVIASLEASSHSMVHIAGLRVLSWMGEEAAPQISRIRMFLRHPPLVAAAAATALSWLGEGGAKSAGRILTQCCHPRWPSQAKGACRDALSAMCNSDHSNTRLAALLSLTTLAERNFDHNSRGASCPKAVGTSLLVSSLDAKARACEEQEQRGHLFCTMALPALGDAFFDEDRRLQQLAANFLLHCSAPSPMEAEEQVDIRTGMTEKHVQFYLEVEFPAKAKWAAVLLRFGQDALEENPYSQEVVRACLKLEESLNSHWPSLRIWQETRKTLPDPDKLSISTAAKRVRVATVCLLRRELKQWKQQLDAMLATHDDDYDEVFLNVPHAVAVYWRQKMVP